MNNDPTPAAFLAARFAAAERFGGPRSGYYRFAAAILTDEPERLEALGAAVTEFPPSKQRVANSQFEPVSSPHGKEIY